MKTTRSAGARDSICGASRSRSAVGDATCCVLSQMPSRLTVITSWFCCDGGCGVVTSTFGGTSTSSPICRIGVATMKMIKSTSTTSTNGVMLISLLTPEPRLLNAIRSSCLAFSLCDLLPGLLILGEDRHAFEFCVVRCFHYQPDFSEVDPLVRFQHDGARRILLIFGGEVFGEVFVGNPILSDEVRSILFDGDAQIAFFAGLLLRVRTFGQQHVDA